MTPEPNVFIDFLSSLFASFFGLGWLQPVFDLIGTLFTTAVALAFMATVFTAFAPAAGG